MVQVKFSLDELQLQEQVIAQSAELYAEVFALDSDLPHLTELALDSWPV